MTAINMLLVIVKDLERIHQYSLDNPHLPTGIGDVSTGIGAHQSRPVIHCQYLFQCSSPTRELGCVIIAYPKQMAMLPAFIRFCE